MPNDCENTLTVTGEMTALEAFRESARGPGGPLEINRFVPMPEELEGVDDPGPELAERLLAAHGASGRFDWRTLNWGTKWDAYETMLDDSPADRLRYRFCTAWNPPGDGVVLAMSEKFPSLNIRLEYSEYELGFRGVKRASGGVLRESWESTIPQGG